MSLPLLKDPFKLGKVLWPKYNFYDKQREIVYSVFNNRRTVVPAGHKLGKDFIAGFTVLTFLLTRHPVRVVTTSVDHSQLNAVLWGEIRRFIQESEYPLDAERGGPLVINHLHIRKVYNGELDGLSYCIARVASRGEGMSGHHLPRGADNEPRTLFVGDEASGIDKETLEKPSEWSHTELWIGNPYECSNGFKEAVKGRPGTEDKGGDVRRENGRGYLRKVIRIRAEDSPNVQYAQAELRAGLQVTNTSLVPGVLTWEDYQERKFFWDEQKKCVGLDAEFWEGAALLMYPPAWLNAAERRDEELKGMKRTAKGIGIDTGEGVAETAMVAVDEHGVVEVEARQTPDTDEIPGDVVAFARKHRCQWRNVLFDRGGGGKQAAQRLQKRGYPVRMVGFSDRPEGTRDVRKLYRNMRAQLYGELRDLFDPAIGTGALKPALLGEKGPVFAMSAKEYELRRQLAPIPLMRDSEGVYYMLPKGGDPKKSLIGLIGCSPDRADALALAVHAMLHPPKVLKAKVVT